MWLTLGVAAIVGFITGFNSEEGDLPALLYFCYGTLVSYPILMLLDRIF